MPLYEFSCLACGRQFDKICKVDVKDSEISCPHCGKQEAKRKLSLFSFGSRTASGDFKPAPASGPSCATCHASSCSSCH